MPRKIELYIRTREHIQRDTEPTEHMKESHRHTILGWEDKMMATSIHRWLPESEARVKKIVENFAKRHGLKLIIYDRYRFWDNVRARLKGVKSTPSVILGKHRFSPGFSVVNLEMASGIPASSLNTRNQIHNRGK
jgi:hypothetical protein